MAKLKSGTYHFKSKTGDELKFTSDVSVTSDGFFHCTIPDELVPIITALLKSQPQKAITCKKNKINHSISGKELKECESFIKLAAEDYIACEVKEELVLVYGTQIKAAYFKNPTGEIFVNGAQPGAAYAKGGKWQGTLDSNSRSNAYSVGFVAVPRKKTTYSRGSGQKVEYKWIGEEQGKYWDLLNSFSGLYVNEESLKDMPYTEEAAKFFYDTMMGLCHLADRIEAFFGNEETLNTAITGQVPLLLSQ